MAKGPSSPLRNGTGAPATSASRTARAVVACAALLAGCATASRNAPPAQLLLRSTVSPGPATVAWSPDGSALAVVRPGGVAIIDLSLGTEQLLPGLAAVAVDWAPSRSLLVTERTADGGRILSVDPTTGKSRPRFAAPGIVAGRWLRDGESWLAISADQAPTPIGLRTTRAVTADLGRGPVELLREEGVLPVREAPADPARGWASARPDAVGQALALASLRKPPALAPYTALVELDPFDPRPVEPARIPLASLHVETTRAPDGRRLAVVAADGVLQVLVDSRTFTAPAGAPRGLHPSWHPTADVLFLGGWLVTPAGAPVRQLLPGGADAVGTWSPAGDRLAVALAGALLVFPTPEEARPPDPRLRATGDALWRLGTLARDGLLMPGLYRERRERLLREGPEEP